MLQKCVIYIFIKVYQEPDSVCVCVCGCGWSTHCGLSYGFIDMLRNAVLLVSSKTFAIHFYIRANATVSLDLHVIFPAECICFTNTKNMKAI